MSSKLTIFFAVVSCILLAVVASMVARVYLPTMLQPAARLAAGPTASPANADQAPVAAVATPPTEIAAAQASDKPSDPVQAPSAPAAAAAADRTAIVSATTVPAAPSAGSPVQLASAPPVAASAPIARERLLRFAGSNTIGGELAPALVKEFLRSRGGSRIEQVKTGEDEFTITADLEGRPIDVTVFAHGSGTAFKALNDRAADIGDASRPIQPKEEQMLEPAAVGRDVGSEFVIGLDGIAVIVHKSNSLDTLTIPQLAGLFSGTATWKDVGGPEACQTVGLYARDSNSGTWDVFDQLVLHSGKNPLPLAATATRFEDSTQLSDAVAADPCGIGFIGLPYVLNNRAMAIKAADRAYLPTLFTVRTEVYPLSRRLFMYTSKTGTNLEVSRFLRFVASPAGQRIVDEIGFISNDVNPPRPEEVPTLDVKYQKLFARIGSNEPLATTIHFRAGSNELDSKAHADLAEIERYFHQRGLAPNSMILIGHTDSIGSHDANCELSKKRAMVVEKELGRLGLFPKNVEGFCDDVPIASNDTADGRDKNRRVEVWIPARKAGRL